MYHSYVDFISDYDSTTQQAYVILYLHKCFSRYWFYISYNR